MFILFKEKFEFDPRKYKSIRDAFFDLNDHDEVPVAYSYDLSDLFSKIPDSPCFHRYSYNLCVAEVFLIQEYDWYFTDKVIDINSLSDLESALPYLELKHTFSVFASEDFFVQLKESDF